MEEVVWLQAQAIPRGADLLSLRKRYSPRQAALLYEQSQLRESSKLPLEEPLLEREALQQATAWPVAEHRARHLQGTVLELGCGIGGDTLALARSGARVIAWEKDPVRLDMARWNLRGYEVEFRAGDWREVDLAGFRPTAIFADPTRRAGQRRVFAPESYDPPLSRLVELAQLAPVCLKVAPGLPDEHVPPGWGVELISHERTCKEAVLWSARSGRWATLIRPEGTLRLESGPQPALAELREGVWLHEPDPAAIRARALGPLAHELGAGPFCSEIAYLVGDRPARSPWAQTFRLVKILKVDWKAITRALAELGWGQLEIKKRGFPVEPEEARRKLKLPKASGAGVLFLTRTDSGHLALLGTRERS